MEDHLRMPECRICNITPTKESPLRPYRVKVRGYLHRVRGGSTVMLLVLGLIAVLFLTSTNTSDVTKMCESKSGGVNLHDLTLEINNTDELFAPPERNLPHCIIVGVRRTGTRALVKFLSIHPEIVPVSKELHFFDQNRNYKKGLDFYHKSMPYSFQGQITVEKTAAYFTDINAPERISNMNSSTKIMIMVREPVLRLVSEYTQMKHAGIKNNKPVKDLEEEALDDNNEVDKLYRPVQISTYHNFVTRWLKHFPREQIHIVDGDLFETDPYSEIYKIETFLGVGHLIKKENFFLNETRGFYCINGGGPISPCLQNIGRDNYPYIKPGLVRKLFKYFRPHNRSFFRQVNRTFTWDNTDDFIRRQRKAKKQSNKEISQETID